MKKQIFISLLILLALINTAKAQWSLTGNTGTTAGTNYLGTTDSKDLVFKTYLIERLRITSAGNVGIGKTTPATVLDVNGIITATGGNSTLWNAKEPGLGNPSINGYVLSSTTSGVRSWIPISGSYMPLVGGTLTNTSGQTLKIIGASLLPATSGSVQTGSALRLTNASTSVLDFGSYNSTGAGWIQATEAGNLATNYALLLNPNGGKVGIGTTIPTKELEVKGSIALSGQILGNSATSHSLDIYGGSGVGAGIIAIGDGTVNQKTVKIISPGTDGDIQFWTGNKSGASMLVRNTDVVFGNPNNFVDLKVNGLVYAREVQVSLTTWWDKVFANDYELMPISELSSFITKNNHLPEVPSEKEVLTNGINVGDMNALLLKKIEELTLYIISQQ